MTSLAIATFFSTTEAATVAIRFSTSEGAKSSVMVNFRVEASGAVIEGLDVVLVPAELGEQEGRGLVEHHDALQREGHVVGRHRRAALELLVRPQLEREGLGIGRDRPAFGDAADQLGHVLGFVAHEAVIDVGED